MAAQECKVPPLTQYCYQSVVANLDRFSSLGRVPYRLVKPILQNCSAESLKQLELNYSNWQAREYLRRTDVEIWQPRCLELLGTDGFGIYASTSRDLPKSWRKEYFTLLKERQSAVIRASDRVSKYRVAQESDQRKAKLTQELPPVRRRNGQSALTAITNPAFRKVVADTRKLSWSSSVGTTGAYFQNSPRPSGYRPIMKSVPSTHDNSLSAKSTPTSSPSIPRSSATGNLFMPKPQTRR